MVKYDRAGSSQLHFKSTPSMGALIITYNLLGGDCQEQDETGEADAVFILQSGASISNVIIGKAQAEGLLLILL